MTYDYASRAEKLVERIVALGPRALTLTSSWDLFKVKDFYCNDLEVTLAQATWALARAQAILREREVK